MPNNSLKAQCAMLAGILGPDAEKLPMEDLSLLTKTVLVVFKYGSQDKLLLDDAELFSDLTATRFKDLAQVYDSLQKLPCPPIHISSTETGMILVEYRQQCLACIVAQNQCRLQELTDHTKYKDVSKSLHELEEVIEDFKNGTPAKDDKNLRVKIFIEYAYESHQKHHNTKLLINKIDIAHLKRLMDTYNDDELRAAWDYYMNPIGRREHDWFSMQGFSLGGFVKSSVIMRCMTGANGGTQASAHSVKHIAHFDSDPERF